MALAGVNLCGQETRTKVERLEPMMSVKAFVKPAFSDTTLLFYSDSLVWNCSMNDGYSYSYYATDFSRVDSCECYEEMYRKLPAKGSSRNQSPERKYRFEMVSRELRAKLTKQSDTVFLYEELDDSELLREEKLIFKWDNVIAVDSLYGEDNQRRLGLTVTRLIQVDNE